MFDVCDGAGNAGGIVMVDGCNGIVLVLAMYHSECLWAGRKVLALFCASC